MFKLIPRIADGSWIIKQSVGTTPVLLVRYGTGGTEGALSQVLLSTSLEAAAASVILHM